MKSKSESKNGRLSAASREAVNKVLDRSIARGSRGKKKQDDSAQSCDSTKVCISSWEEDYCHSDFTKFIRLLEMLGAPVLSGLRFRSS